MEITFRCSDGDQLCSFQILCQSQFYYQKARSMIRMNNELTFDYKNYSKDSVKLFLDSLHLIEPNPTDIVQE